MYTLDINYYKRQGVVYIVISVITLIFSTVYEYFSHDVFSYFMMYAFMIPLILGVLISFTIYLGKLRTQTRIEMNLYNAGVATLTVGSLISGVLEIYGTTNGKVHVYWVVGGVLLLISITLKLKFDNLHKI